MQYKIINFLPILFLSLTPCYALDIKSLLGANQVEAYAGKPYGVGRITIDVLRGEPILPLRDERFTLQEATGRAMYPVLEEEGSRRLLRQALQIESPGKVTFYFLFQGDQPFDLSVYAPHEQGMRVKPQYDDAEHQRLLDTWWQQLTGRLGVLQKAADYPPVVENFLVATFSRRLERDLPKPKQGILPWNKPKKDSVFDELFLTESYRLKADRNKLSQHAQTQQNVVPIPEPTLWITPDAVAEDLVEVQVEPIAALVPAECFYLRFGNFTNYLWFRDFNKKWQGDLGNMILRRGIRQGSSQRIGEQLSLRENALAKILGPQFIADVAIIGLDPYVTEGAALGILFQAKNSFLLSNDLMKQRREALQKHPEAEEQTIQLAGQEVSLIATPNGQIRSYYVKHEDFHLVTTSSLLATRFIQAAGGDGPLAELPSYLEARQEMPLERNDALFAFISEEFFQNLCTPQYRIETLRRLHASRERHHLELARYAAKVEGHTAYTQEELIKADFLPKGFGLRPDESKLIETEDGYLDSLRGVPGYFLPVADVIPEFATSKETDEFQDFITRFQSEVGQMPPIAVGVQRMPHKNEVDESILIDLWVNHLATSKLGALFEPLGEPIEHKLRPIEGDLLAVEATVEIPVPLIGGENQPHHLFGALRDFRAPLVVTNGQIESEGPPSELVRGYLGVWPKPGILEMFLGSAHSLGNAADHAEGQLLQAQQDDFLLLSFKADILEHVLPQLALESDERPAQVRLRLQDLTRTQMAHSLNALGYMRSRETTVAASRMMNALANRLQVPRPDCRKVAERLVDGEFICALGGDYQLYAPQRGLEVWLSSALPEQNQFLLTEVPEDFQLPLLSWFRGCEGDLQVTDELLRAQLKIDMTEAALP